MQPSIVRNNSISSGEYANSALLFLAASVLQMFVPMSRRSRPSSFCRSAWWAFRGEVGSAAQRGHAVCSSALRGPGWTLPHVQTCAGAQGTSQPCLLWSSCWQCSCTFCCVDRRAHRRSRRAHGKAGWSVNSGVMMSSTILGGGLKAVGTCWDTVESLCRDVVEAGAGQSFQALFP